MLLPLVYHKIVSNGVEKQYKNKNLQICHFADFPIHIELLDHSVLLISASRTAKTFARSSSESASSCSEIREAFTL